MPTSKLTADPRVKALRFERGHLILAMEDGREVRAPLALYPSLADAALKDLRDYTLSPNGLGIHWPTLDEDLTVEGILLGRPVPSPSLPGQGPLLRAARLHAGLTQAQLATAIGYSQPKVSLAEADPPRIPVLPSYVARVLKACGLPKGWRPEKEARITVIPVGRPGSLVTRRPNGTVVHLQVRRSGAEESVLAPAASAKPHRTHSTVHRTAATAATTQKKAAAPRRAKAASAARRPKAKA